MEWQHVYPINDLKEHQLGNWMMWNEAGTEQHPYCDCNPEIDWENKICIHNAWDLREAQEYINNN